MGCVICRNQCKMKRRPLVQKSDSRQILEPSGVPSNLGALCDGAGTWTWVPVFEAPMMGGGGVHFYVDLAHLGFTEGSPGETCWSWQLDPCLPFPGGSSLSPLTAGVCVCVCVSEPASVPLTLGNLGNRGGLAAEKCSPTFAHCKETLEYVFRECGYPFPGSSRCSGEGV